MPYKIDIQALKWESKQVKNFFGKDLLQLDNGTVKLVKVNPFAIYPDHVHPNKTEYVYVLEGHPHFLIGIEEFAAEPNEFYLFPINTKHAIRNKTDKECLLLVGSIKN